MAVSEFELIERFFARASYPRKDVLLGVGDDCALLRVPDGQEVMVVYGSLVAERDAKALPDTRLLAEKLIHPLLDALQRAGAIPVGYTLSITLPEADQTWLARFSGLLQEMNDRLGIALIGGDTTHGPWSITLHALGYRRKTQQDAAA